MKSNIQHAIPCRERRQLAGELSPCICGHHRLEAVAPGGGGQSSLPRAGYWMFLLFIFSASPAFAQTDTNALPALTPAYGELPPTFWQQHETPIIVGSFALLAVVFLFLRVLRRPETPVILPPEVLARRTLAKLPPRPEDGKLLSEIAHVLRRYVVAAFEWPAAEMTTAEFCAALAADEKIGAETAGFISSFLRECDERKFSTLPVSAPLNAANRALQIVAKAEARRLRSAPVPGAATPKIQDAAVDQQTRPISDVAASGDGRTPR